MAEHVCPNEAAPFETEEMLVSRLRIADQLAAPSYGNSETEGTLAKTRS
jgi:hypothetical protein